MAADYKQVLAKIKTIKTKKKEWWHVKCHHSFFLKIKMKRKQLFYFKTLYLVSFTHWLF